MKVARITKDKELMLAGEIIEFPLELMGGRNLLLNSSLTKNSGIFNANQNVTLTNPDNEYLRVYSNQDKSTPGIIIRNYDVEDCSYTISFDARGIGGITEVRVWFRGPSASLSISQDEFQRVSATLNPTFASDFFLIGITNTAIGQGFEIKNVKVEKESRATPWTPAPEDLGLNYPDDIQSFGVSLLSDGSLTVNEIIERAVTDLDSAGWDGWSNNQYLTQIAPHEYKFAGFSTTGAFLYKWFDFKDKHIRVQVEAKGEADTIGKQIRWQSAAIGHYSTPVTLTDEYKVVSTDILFPQNNVAIGPILIDGILATDAVYLRYKTIAETKDYRFNVFENTILTSELIEGCDFGEIVDGDWDEFVPEYGADGAEFYTNAIRVPFDCTLYMNVETNGRPMPYNLNWMIGERRIWGLMDNVWDNQTVDVEQGEELAIQGVVIDEDSFGTIKLHLNDAYGEVVIQFDYELEAPCFLTTAMVNYYGKADDGIELTAIRALREHYRCKHRDTLLEYSRASYFIIQGIKNSRNKEYYYNVIKKVVDNIVIWVADKKWQKAEIAYLNLYYELKQLFLLEGDNNG